MRMDADGSRAGKNCSTVANTTIYSNDFNTDFPLCCNCSQSLNRLQVVRTLNLRNGERERNDSSSSIYVSAQQKSRCFLWRGRVCLYIISISSLYPLTELVICSYLHTSCECFSEVSCKSVLHRSRRRHALCSPVLIWLGCTLCTCLRRCQRSTRASVW